MKRVLIDLNVLLDVLLDREPHVGAAAALWSAIEGRQAEGLVPAHGFTTIFYLVAKRRGPVDARRVVADLLTVFGVAAVDERVLRRAASLGLADFEDSVAAAAAEAAGCEAIVTRDLRGFEASPVGALEPLVALATLDTEVHETTTEYRVAGDRVAGDRVAGDRLRRRRPRQRAGEG